MLIKLFTINAVFLIGLLFVTPAAGQYHYKANGKVQHIPDDLKNQVTYSGEIYKPENLVATHVSLPFGTLLQVHNPENGKSIQVKIIHRGPFNSDALIGLSDKAIELLDIQDNISVVECLYQGKKKIQTTQKNNTYYLLNTQEANPKGYGVQIGSFHNKDNILVITNSLNDHIKENLYIQVFKDTQIYYRLIIGDLDNIKKANTLRDELENQFPGCYVINFLDYE